jgi:hypothetical protein
VNRVINFLNRPLDCIWNKLGVKMRSKLIKIFLFVNVIPLIILSFIAWRQLVLLSERLSDIATEDAAVALNDIATENIERMTTDTARMVAEFLYGRDQDILFLAGTGQSEENYRQFIETKLGHLLRKSEWVLSPFGKSWMPFNTPVPEWTSGKSTNNENNDMNGFRYLQPEAFRYDRVPVYDEITYIELNGNELIKVTAASSPKVNYPLSSERKNVSRQENTYVKAETYFQELLKLKPGEIYVSDVIGAYVGTNYIGMYVPSVVSMAANTRGYDIEFDPQAQAYAGKENPNGRRFEGIVRWAAPVTGKNGEISGYVTFALNHDHIMEFVDHQPPMNER